MSAPQGKALDLFDAYRANLLKVAQDRAPREAILCPLDLSPITRDDVFGRRVGVEHIVPQHSTADGKLKSLFTKLAVKDVRSGLTLTCAVCNGKKGRELDLPLRGLIAPGVRRPQEYTYRTGTAILTYAYLFAFAVFGYEYIFKPEAEEIRRQFQDPDGRHTAWLDHAQVCTANIEQPIVANEWGYPFVARIARGAPIELSFWRFRAKLPSIDGVRTAVEIPESISGLAHL
jgi:hypothetical protein